MTGTTARRGEPARPLPPGRPPPAPGGVSRQRHPGGDDRGQTTVELALALPFVVLLIMVLAQVGLVLRDQQMAVHAAREGARAAAVSGDSGAAEQAAVAATGLDRDRLDVSVTGREGEGSRVRVTVRYRSPTELPLVGTFLDDVEVTSAATMRVER